MMRINTGDTVTILANGRFRKVDVTGSTVGKKVIMRVGVFKGTSHVVWFTEADVLGGTRMVADDR